MSCGKELKSFEKTIQKFRINKKLSGIYNGVECKKVKK